MSVIHILKDGSRPTDITGHIVRSGDVSSLYQMLHSINRKRSEIKKKNTVTILKNNFKEVSTL
jgi:hypothetical protein